MRATVERVAESVVKGQEACGICQKWKGSGGESLRETR